MGNAGQPAGISDFMRLVNHRCSAIDCLPGERSVTRAHDKGAGTVMAIALVVVTVATAGIIGVVLGAVSRAHESVRTAELAALAAADATVSPDPADSCGDAARVAHSRGATMASCTRVGNSTQVQVILQGFTASAAAGLE